MRRLMSGAPFLVCTSIGAVALLAGCWPALIPTSSVEIPAQLQYVMDNASTFRVTEEDTLANVNSGAAIADASELDGCWGAMFVEGEAAVPVALFLVYQFDGASGTYVSWSALGRTTGQLAPLMPLISAETGTYTVEAGSVLRTMAEQFSANMDPETAALTNTLQEQYRPSSPVERLMAVTLSGDRLFVTYDLETTDSDSDEVDRIILIRFDCVDAE